MSTLAPELLHDIFSLAHKTEKPAAPLSRSLRPFYDAVKFCEVVARGGRRIHSLLESVTARPELGSLVHKIDLVDHDRFTQLGMADMQALFASFPDVRELSITAGDPSCLEVIFPTRDGAQTALQESTKVLSVVCSKSHGGGYDSNVLATLKRLPNLNEILLDFPDGTSNQADPGMAKFSLPAIVPPPGSAWERCDRWRLRRVFSSPTPPQPQGEWSHVRLLARPRRCQVA